MTTITGTDNILAVRELALRAALDLEIKTGMRRSSRGPSTLSIIKREYGLTGNKKKVLEQFEAMLIEQGKWYPKEAQQ